MKRSGLIGERAASILMALGGVGHGVGGTLLEMPLMQFATLWSFAGAVEAWILAALGWLASTRPGDKGLALLIMAGNAAWIGLMVWFMAISGEVADPRPWLFILCSTALFAFSARRAFARI